MRSGLGHQWKSYKAYTEALAQKGPGAPDHSRFLGALKDWIKAQNLEPGRTTLRSKSALNEVFQRVEVQRTTGGRLRGPKYQFVLASAWDTEAWGPLDKEKIVEQQACSPLLWGVGLSDGVGLPAVKPHAGRFSAGSKACAAPVRHPPPSGSWESRAGRVAPGGQNRRLRF